LPFAVVAAYANEEIAVGSMYAGGIDASLAGIVLKIDSTARVDASYFAGIDQSLDPAL
jgi:hypothetical protein